MATSVSDRPALESGDHLTRREFHRIYSKRPDIKKAELVEGIVYVASPVSAQHAELLLAVVGWLYAYVAMAPGVRGYTDGTVQIDDDNEVQPDAFLVRSPDIETQIREDARGYFEGAPPLVIEVAVSSASYDLHSKKRVYERAGVQEYIAWRVRDRQIDWFRLQSGAYVSVSPDADGVIESAVFPGLRLDVAKMLAGDAAGVLAALRSPNWKSG